MSKKSTKSVIIFGFILIILIFTSLHSYNSFVAKDEAVATAWANIQSQYQRRSDLISDLVNTISGYTKRESEILESEVSACAQAAQISTTADDLTAEKLEELQATQGKLSQALVRLLAITEKYPELKANEYFSEFRSKLERIENRINESQQLYNNAVRDYNASVQRFPSNIIATLFGFKPKIQIQAEYGTEKASRVTRSERL